MDCSKFSKVLDKVFKIPLAESWDNVGLILQPSPPFNVKKIMLTNDLTEPVLNEGIKSGANFIISYHPPIFRALKKITQNSWKERIIIKCLENRIALYSPHTALDAVSGGVNDWLVSPFESSEIYPLDKHKCTEQPPLLSVKSGENIQAYCMKNHISPQRVDIQSEYGDLTELSHSDEANELGDCIISKCDSYKFSESEGYGRIILLKKHLIINDIVEAYKKLFNVPYLKVAIGYGKTLDSPVCCLAVCAGSGGSLLTSQPIALLADVYVTGEMSHHEQLEIVSRGATVITAGHSVSERGYLAQCLKPWLEKTLVEYGADKAGSITIEVSCADAEPGIIL